MAPLGVLLTNEKKRVACPVVLATRTLMREGPTIEIGLCNLALSRNPLWPGMNAGLKPAMLEAKVAANAPAEPIPGRAEIALGIPPTG